MGRREMSAGWVDQRVGSIIKIALIAVLLSGCGSVGPRAITNGRTSYNEALAATNDQQILAFIVRHRYGQTASLMSVVSVTANFKVTASADAEIGVGPNENFSGNLVPLSAGVGYEENPTISYVPIEGEKYIRQLLSPVPLDLTLLMYGSGKRSRQVFEMLIDSINGIQNHTFLAPPSVQSDPRFGRISELMAMLTALRHLDWVEDKNGSMSLVIHGYAPEYIDEVEELLRLNGLQGPADPSADIVIPASIAVGRGGAEGIAITTRSVFDLVEIAAASIDVPADHIEAGWTATVPDLGLVGNHIQIRSSENRPAKAAVAVKHEGRWFYIDRTDAASKEFFRILETLVSVRIANTEDHQRLAPRLTLPVN